MNRIGEHIMSILDNGIFELTKIRHEHFIGTCNLTDVCFILVPAYMNRYIIEALRFSCGGDQVLNICYKGHKILPSPYFNKIIFYHKDFPMLGIEPIVYEVEVTKCELVK